jgi:dTDP-glucose 4,6-dehydratase
MSETLRAPKSLLVTGGAGFIGSSFIRRLFRDSAFRGKVVNLDLLTYAGNPENLKGAVDPERYELVRGDIGDQKLVDEVCERHGIDAIVNFAAESHVDRSILGPGVFVQTNVVGTYALLEVVRKRPSIHFHHVSTDEVYGSLGETGLFTETTPYDPSSPYSASKAASDHLVRAYQRTYGISTTVSNCSNNYGPQHSRLALRRRSRRGAVGDLDARSRWPDLQRGRQQRVDQHRDRQAPDRAGGRATRQTQG